MPDATDSRLDAVDSSSLTDAMGRLHDHRAHVLDWTSPDPTKACFGPAVTMRFVPARADLDGDAYAWNRRFHEAIGEQPAERVLVCSSSCRRDISLGGGTKLSRLDHEGLAGALVDGRLRDFDELAQLDAAVFCRGRTTRWGGDERLAIGVDVPVVVGGVTVVPGDWVYADEAGAVVIPADDVDEVLDEAVEIEREDARYKQAVAEETRERVLSGDAARGPEDT